MTYQTEFPDFPADTMPALPAGFVDQSWHNDICPFFVHEASGIGVWIDYADPAQREIDGRPRFMVVQSPERDPAGGWQFGGGEIDLFETDDWETVVRSLPHFMADMADEMEASPPAEAARTIRARLNMATLADLKALHAAELAAGKPDPLFIAVLEASIARAEAPQ